MVNEFVPDNVNIHSRELSTRTSAEPLLSIMGHRTLVGFNHNQRRQEKWKCLTNPNRGWKKHETESNVSSISIRGTGWISCMGSAYVVRHLRRACKDGCNG